MYRSDTNGQEHSVWSKVPQNQSIGNLAFMGNLIFEEPLGKHNKALIDFCLGNNFYKRIKT